MTPPKTAWRTHPRAVPFPCPSPPFQTWSRHLNMLVNALKDPTSMTHHRQARGHVIIKARPSQERGLPVFLCLERGYLSLQGGSELDDELLSMSFDRVVISLVSGHDNMFRIMVDCDTTRQGSNDDAVDRIIIALPDTSTRDKWFLHFPSINKTGNQAQTWRTNTSGKVSVLSAKAHSLWLDG